MYIFSYIHLTFLGGALNMDSKKQSEGFELVVGWEFGVPGGGYYRGHGLHGSLGVVQKQ